MLDRTINDDKTITGGIGTMLAGRYHILRQLGEGGMGSVWLAEDRQLDNRKVAIKMLPTIVVKDQRAYQQLKSEALVSLKLVHPNIVTLRAFEENNGAPFLVMDYIDGQTLSDYLAVKGKLSEKETVALLKPIAAALDYAHSEKVIHRDVKPSNIIIRKDGHTFILDFGIAREIQESMTRVTGKTISGTLLYMSPEQLRGAPPAPAQDVYSFSAMVYECLTGNPPFTRGEIVYQILNVPPSPLPMTMTIAINVMLGLSKQINRRPKKCADVVTRHDKPQNMMLPTFNTQCLTNVWFWIVVGLCCIVGIMLLWTQRIKDGEKSEGDENKLNPHIEVRKKIKERTLVLPGGAKIEMIYCPPGSFLMGSPESEAGRSAGYDKYEDKWYDNEKQHLAKIENGFWLGKFEVTQGQWQSVMGNNPSAIFKGEDRKETRVKVPEMSDSFYDLLSDATLEKIAAGGDPYESMTDNELEMVASGSWRGDNPSRIFKGENKSRQFDKPVQNISVEDCEKFFQKVNAVLQCDARLPTETEWEYACRAGTTTAYFWGNSLNGDRANCDGTKPCGTTIKGRKRGWITPVGSFPPNPWGFYDMHGNVSEICGDEYTASDSTFRMMADVLRKESGSVRVLRGGNYAWGAADCRSASRGMIAADKKSHQFGFRLCCSRLP